ncbi:MAG: heavy-metal-associated domain-containing protein [Jatrophihabitantaceae bacterium]
MNTTSYQVTGLTCGHCVAAVSHELQALPEVSEVSVDLVAGGVSTVTVTSAEPLVEQALTTALDEAGGYQLASR